MKSPLCSPANLPILQAILLVTVISSYKSNSQIVLTQVYGGGGASTGTPAFRNDYIEIFNRGTTVLDLAGYSVQYAPAGTSTWSVTMLSGPIAPGHYYLIQEGGGSLGSILPTPDATGTISMNAANGKVALVGGVAALIGSCPAGSPILDMIGYGTASCFEGAAPAATLSTTLAALRIDGGCVDTDNNSTDFVTGTPTPHNSSSAAHECSAIPIQLSYFRGSANPRTGRVDLTWGTISEINNYGFQLERKAEPECAFRLIPGSFVPGHGTTLVPQQYSFSDPEVNAGVWLYRLEAIDLDGTRHVSDPVSVHTPSGIEETRALPLSHALRCYPNPFNPLTRIEFTLGRRCWTRVDILDLQGRVVATLIDSPLSPGEHGTTWKAQGLSGGLYLCRLSASGQMRTVKVLFLK